MPTKRIGSTPCTMALNKAVERPAVVDYTLTKRYIKVTSRLILRTPTLSIWGL
jgi:hypothetical protein